MSDAFTVRWSKRVAKQLDSLPDQIVRKFYAWVSVVQLTGLRETRKSPGFHDEPLKGERKGQRSVRLNKDYRAIYIETTDGEIELVEVTEVNKHDY
jgi:proteic killer suppression protein